jgi:hypothetical protein
MTVSRKKLGPNLSRAGLGIKLHGVNHYLEQGFDEISERPFGRP